MGGNVSALCGRRAPVPQKMMGINGEWMVRRLLDVLYPLLSSSSSPIHQQTPWAERARWWGCRSALGQHPLPLTFFFTGFFFGF